MRPTTPAVRLHVSCCSRMTAHSRSPSGKPLVAQEVPAPQTASGDPTEALRVLALTIAVAAAIFAAGVGTGLLVVGRHGGGPIQGWDNHVQDWSIGHRAGLIGVSKVIAYIGDAPKLAVVAVVLTAILWWVLRSIVALVPLLAYLGGEFQVFAIRQVIHRPRPPTANFPAPGAIAGVHETSFSFPSGHSVAVTAVLFALAGTATLGRRRWWPWAVALIAALIVADSRLVLGVHWFSDVTLGLLLGICWGITIARAIRRIEAPDLKAVLRLR